MAKPTCRHCGGQRVIEQAKVEDRGDHAPGQLSVLLAYGDPGALVFKEPIRAELRATVCCDCGRVDLFIENPEMVWSQLGSAPKQPPPD